MTTRLVNKFINVKNFINKTVMSVSVLKSVICVLLFSLPTAQLIKDFAFMGNELASPLIG